MYSAQNLCYNLLEQSQIFAKLGCKMIEIKNVTKIYHAKKKSQHKALDNVNLTLQDNGLVFVIGKSGSGKSTLLNLIGGLDSVTEGNIVVDGNDITNYTEGQLSNYRSGHIGFIFQDYHLLEELTVAENICLSLDLVCEEDDGRVAEALKKVGLDGYQDRYPDELSGGEQQRVAIARAIVKRPKLILADEPTGNLDNVTATAIIHLLKELAQDCLILIVSHNTVDTYTYADRIIQLSAGKVVSDLCRNTNFSTEITFHQDQLVYPCDKALDDSDVRAINQKLASNQLQKVVLAKDKYVQTEQPSTTNARKVKINNTKPTFKRVTNLCGTFLKSRLLRIAISSFLIAVIIVILSFSQTIIAFDSGSVIEEEMRKDKQESLFVRKQNNDVNVFLNHEKYYEMLDESVFKQLQNDNPNTKVYPVYNSTVAIRNSYGSYNVKYGYSMVNATFIETFGTMVVDEQFFIDKLGKLEFVAKLDNPDPRGVYITDFVADQILANVSKYRKKQPEDILGYYSYNNSYNMSYINGIIKTDYLSKHDELLKKLVKSTSEEITQMREQQEYKTFLNDLYDHLGFCYSFNANFVADNKAQPLQTVAWTYNIAFSVEDKKIPANITNGRFVMHTDDPKHSKPQGLVGNEVSMNYQRFNEIFGTNFAANTISNFVPQEVTISQHNFYDYDLDSPLLTTKVTIKKLHITAAMFIVSDEIYNAMVQNSHFLQGIYFDEISNISSIINQCYNLNLTFEHHLVEGIQTMSRAVEVFVDIFELVGGVLCIGAVFLLVNTSSKMISDKYHDIGILKALGCKNSTIGVIFGLQLLLIAICTAILSILGYGAFIGVANDILVNSLQILAPGRVVLDLDFLKFIPIIAIMDAILVFVLGAISFVFPMLKIRKINPVQIIKTREE